MYDVVVLGGGPAGVTAALRARELGASAALIEKGRMGGTCTNDGCVPTRVLAKAARLLRDSEQFETYGIQLTERPQIDFAAVLKRTQEVVYQVHEKKQLFSHLQDVDVEVFNNAGAAAFVDPHTIETEGGQRVQGKHFIICVGGSPRMLNLPGSEYALTHSDVWSLKQQPKSVAIVGSGATGCQLASIFNAFGSEVTLLDVADRILLSEDALVADTVEKHFIHHGIDVQTGIGGVDRIERAEQANGGRPAYNLIYRMDNEVRTLPVEAVIMSVGWPGNTDGLGLDAAGIERQGSYVKVNDAMQTSVPHIYAAGDITGRVMLVQSAGHQARVAVENALLNEQRGLEHVLLPHGGFTDPEYGGVGLTESQAREQYDVAVAVVPYADLDRAVIDGRTVGFCKLIIDRETHRVLGAHVVGEQALEVVQMIATGMASDLTIEELTQLELAYPTFAAIIGLAARQLVREIGKVRIAQEWRTIQEARPTEWERRD